MYTNLSSTRYISARKIFCPQQKYFSGFEPAISEIPDHNGDRAQIETLRIYNSKCINI